MNLFTVGVSERLALHRPPAYVCVFVRLCVCVQGSEFEKVAGRTGGGDAASCLQHGMVGNLRTEEEEE